MRQIRAMTAPPRAAISSTIHRVSRKAIRYTPRKAREPVRGAARAALPLRRAPALACVAVMVLALTGCGYRRFSYLHGSDRGPVGAEAAALAQQYRLGPDGYGKIKLGMTMTDAQETGQFVLSKGRGMDDCEVGFQTGTGIGPSHGGLVSISGAYGVAKIATYTGVHTPEGIGLGATIDEVKTVYPDTRVETEADMGNGQIEMDAHYRSSVPGNPKEPTDSSSTKTTRWTRWNSHSPRRTVTSDTQTKNHP